MGLLGRTNREFPTVWLSLATPDFGSDGWVPELVEAALAASTVIDISSNPGLWGGQMRGTDAFLMTLGTTDVERGISQEHTADLVQAHIIETLSAVGREHLDFYFLRIRDGLQEFQINGALEALEAFKQPGHIRYLGLACEGPPMATLGAWQWHDGFEVLLTPSACYEDLRGLAQERRVGIVTTGEPREAHPHLVRVRTPQEIREATQVGSAF